MALIGWIKRLAKFAAFSAAVLVGAGNAAARADIGFDTGIAGVLFFPFAAFDAPETRRSFKASENAAATPPQSQPGSLTALFHNGGMLGGFAAGFLGAGLLGVLFGRGLFGGLGGAASYLGLAFQLVLLLSFARLLFERWHAGRVAPPPVLSSRQLADPYLRSRDDLRAGLDASAPLHGDADEVGHAG